MKIKPLADRVVIKPTPAEEKTKGGLIVPDTAKEKPVIGEVVAVGPGKVSDDGKKIQLEVKVGDKVLYGKYSGTEVTVDGEEYLIMREADIFAIV
jgi:chaperonin GroES